MACSVFHTFQYQQLLVSNAFLKVRWEYLTRLVIYVSCCIFIPFRNRITVWNFHRKATPYLQLELFLAHPKIFLPYPFTRVFLGNGCWRQEHKWSECLKFYKYFTLSGQIYLHSNSCTTKQIAFLKHRKRKLRCKRSVVWASKCRSTCLLL